MGIEFEHPGNGYGPNQALIHGVSTTVSSGDYIDRDTPHPCMYGGGISTVQVDQEHFTVTFTRVR
jgi:hypothetical protein